MRLVVSNVESLVAHVQFGLRSSSTVIAIDGVPGAGKTYLAKQLEDTFGLAPALDFDRFLYREQDQHLGLFRLDDLKEAIHARKPQILSGVCMLSVLTALGMREASHVYVKRVCSWGWADEVETTTSGLEDLENVANPAGKRDALTREVLNYHLTYKPHQCADVVYERLDES
jgi:tRNA A37 threonylcarbamoyladenosine biosynthesis protein TsaE